MSNTRKSVSSDIQTLRSWFRNSACASFFNLFLSGWIADKTLFLVFVILLHNRVPHIQHSRVHQLLQNKGLLIYPRLFLLTIATKKPSNLFQQQVSATGEISKKTSKSALNRPEFLFRVFTGQEPQTLYKVNEVGNSLVDGKYCGDQIMQLFTHYCFNQGRKRSK